MTDEQTQQYIKLCAIKEIGAITAMRLLRHFGSPRAVLEAPKSELMRVDKIGEKTAEAIVNGRDCVDASKIMDALRRIGARYFAHTEPEYPRQLQTMPDKPVGLYAIGDCDLSAPCISIVGSRGCTVYGQTTTRRFAAEFARAGYTVVSGMARGIDTMAHLGALEAGGKTIAVLGTGVDVIYPPENADLYKKIIEAGAVISEFPIGARADRQNFPIRNRIVAGMSLATIVVESDIKGGSMITARLAGEYGRDVFAVPGRIDSPLSRGCHALLKDGAMLAASADDVLEALEFSRQSKMNLFGGAAESPQKAENPAPQPAPRAACAAPSAKLSADEKTVFDIVNREKQIRADTIAELSKMEIKRLLPALSMLEIKKLISKDAGGNYSPRGK